MKTAEQEAKEIIENFKGEINESDFHIPKFISGVDMESEEYGDVLEKETNDLAKQCALIYCNGMIDSILRYNNDKVFKEHFIFLTEVKQIIETKY